MWFKHKQPKHKASINDKYLNLFTDYGFKKVFKNKESLTALKDLIATMLQQFGQEVTDIHLTDPEKLGVRRKDRKSIFDLQCESSDGSTFVVEVQNCYQKYFTDRILYYVSRLIMAQGKRGKWNFKLNKVYIVSLMNFSGSDISSADSESYLKHVRLVDIKTNEVLTDKLGLVFIDAKKFHKKLDDLEERADKWVYYLKNLHTLRKEPEDVPDKVFSKLLEMAKVEDLNEKEARMYKTKYELRWEKQAIEEGRIELALKKGRQEEKYKIAKTMFAKGLDNQTVSEITGLSQEELSKL